ncbi:XRE family transcriptional regulator [Streptomyces albofaciens JCM 4342]|uniref:helix-turn-helix domain-containing protein n=1 Tax=Streptomyces albofaciens TaxID=66866 RepID=UPI000A5F2D23|nr:helix-turn-helix transcriptional regulator [Streptomyces albofaciens]KAA6213775.1 XRE family transcriptional regulator [Streptomyces albofaciens JCM 4342]
MARAKVPPTVRQRRLGAELRRLRERAGLSVTRAGELFGAPQSRISNIEAGNYAVSADRVRALARLYKCSDDALVQALTAMTGGRTRGWWDEYRELLPTALVEVAEFEHEATALQVAVLVAMPGLLQSVEHVRAAYNQNVPALRPFEIEHCTAFRIRRQGVLHGEAPLPYTAIIHEAALRMGIGGIDVVRAQLRHLMDMGEYEHITIQVIPFGRADFPASGGQPITYACGPVPQLDTVLLDTDHGLEILHAEDQLARYREVLDRMRRCALDPAESRNFIHKIAKSL